MSRHNLERRKDRALPKYAPATIAVAAKAMAEGKLRPGQVHMIDVRHDDGCGLLAGNGPCDCESDVGQPRRVPSPEEN